MFDLTSLVPTIQPTATFVDSVRWPDTILAILVPNQSESTRHVEYPLVLVTLPVLALVRQVRKVKLVVVARAFWGQQVRVRARDRVRARVREV